MYMVSKSRQGKKNRFISEIIFRTFETRIHCSILIVYFNTLVIFDASESFHHILFTVSAGSVFIPQTLLTI